MPSAHPTNCQHDHFALHHHTLRESASTRMRGNVRQGGRPPISNHQGQTSVKKSTGGLHFTLAHAHQRTQILAYSDQTVESSLSGATTLSSRNEDQDVQLPAAFFPHEVDRMDM
jgi:hypothetical protein